MVSTTRCGIAQNRRRIFATKRVFFDGLINGNGFARTNLFRRKIKTFKVTQMKTKTVRSFVTHNALFVKRSNGDYIRCQMQIKTPFPV